MKLIVAKSKDDVIAIDGDMPWYIPSDLKNFKRLTCGKMGTVLMGRKTFNTLNDKPLPDRQNIVFSRSLVRRDLIIERTFSRMRLYPDSWIMGGAEVYQYALDNDLCDELVVTEIDVEYPDIPDRKKVFFPKIDRSKWKVKRREILQKRDGDSHRYNIVHYVRREDDNSI